MRSCRTRAQRRENCTMQIEAKKIDGLTTFIVTGRLNAGTAPAAEDALTEAIDAGASRIVLNLAGVDLITSAGLRILVATSKKLSRQKGKLVLCELQSGVLHVLEISGLLTIFLVAGTEAEAQSLAMH